MLFAKCDTSKSAQPTCNALHVKIYCKKYHTSPDNVAIIYEEASHSNKKMNKVPVPATCIHIFCFYRNVFQLRRMPTSVVCETMAVVNWSGLDRRMHCANSTNYSEARNVNISFSICIVFVFTLVKNDFLLFIFTRSNEAGTGRELERNVDMWKQNAILIKII